MSEHLTKEQLEHFAERSLAPAELLEVDEHLAGCSECRELAMAASATPVAGIRRVFTPTVDDGLEHLDYELIERYVDGTLSDVDKEIVLGHLEICRSCAEEVAELRSFRDVSASEPEKVYAPATGSGIFQRMDATPTLSMGAKSTAAIRRPVYRFAPAFAMAAAILIAAVVVLNHGNHSARPDMTPGAQVAQAPSAPNNVTTPPFTPAPPTPVSPAPPVEKPSTGRSTAPTSPVLQRGEAQSKSTRRESPAEPAMRLRTTAQPEPTHAKPTSTGAKPESSPAPAGGGTLLHPNDMLAMGAPTPKSTAVGSTNGPAAATAINSAGQAVPAPAAPPALMEKMAAKTSTLPNSVKQALSTGHIDLNTPEIRELTGTGAAMDELGATPASFTVTSPVSTAVLSDRPAFSWGVSKEASAYQVSVVDANGGDVEDSPVVSTTSWKADKPLPRGELLKWRVKAMQNGTVVETAPGDGARFRVIDADRAAQIEDASKTFADQPAALGILYAQAGMFDDAERELSKASKSDPGNEVVTKLLSDVRSVRAVP